MVIATSRPSHPTLADLRWFLRQARPRCTRSLRAFAEEEIVIPDGPYVGRRFQCKTQPYTGLWFNAVDSHQWSRFVASGPTQSGKTLACFVIPLLYHLFELDETVICGLPDMDMAGDKWREDILPAIEQSRYRELMPAHGGGSRGGRVESIQFRNGATLKFMSGGGGDKSRAGFTSRVVVITETDGMDQPGGGSRESDKITQLEARTRAYGSRKRIYMECTVSTEEGRTWQEYQRGTRSRILLPCRQCGVWVGPERQDLAGWQDAETQAAAGSAGAFVCPACGQLWSAEDRTEANRRGQLVHGDQTIDAQGSVQGVPPATDTLGFRWSAVNNLFLTPGELAADEWRASRAADEENAEREMRQFVWCLPVEPAQLDQTALAVHELASRTSQIARGFVPPDVQYLTAALDLGKYLAHWLVVAWSPTAVAHVVDYGRLEVASDDLGVEQALLVALREFRQMASAGWPDLDGKRRLPDQVWIDSGYMAPVVYAFCRESGSVYRPAVGRGAAQQRVPSYSRPARISATVRHIGEGFHLNYLPTEKLTLCVVDSDYWKTWVHQRLTTPVGQPGALTLFAAPAHEHLAFAHHLTAEKKVEEFVPGKHVVVKWQRVRKQNHWFDALYNACAAGHYAGVRLVDEPLRRTPPPGERPTAQELFERSRTAERLRC